MDNKSMIDDLVAQLDAGFSADKAKYVLGKIENKFRWEFILTRIYK